MVSQALNAWLVKTHADALRKRAVGPFLRRLQRRQRERLWGEWLEARNERTASVRACASASASVVQLRCSRALAAWHEVAAAAVAARRALLKAFYVWSLQVRDAF